MRCAGCNDTGMNGSGGICSCKYIRPVAEMVKVPKQAAQLPYDQWDDNVLTVRATTLAHTIPRMQAELAAVRKEIKKRKKARAGT